MHSSPEEMTILSADSCSLWLSEKEVWIRFQLPQSSGVVALRLTPAEARRMAEELQRTATLAETFRVRLSSVGEITNGDKKARP